ncbi:MAG: sugar lactone lactonase YvrE [Paraglaciecola sp.]|jgi:sugar lactone lactonase YvrE
MKIAKILLGIIVVTCIYLTLWPVPVDPIAWHAPENKGFVDDYAANADLLPLEFLNLHNEHGPEDLAINDKGTIVVSLHSGALMKLENGATELRQWVNTGGRPLGIEFDANNNLIVADAYIGLLSVSPQGNITLLTNTAEGIPINYADDIDIANDGKIYFSDATEKFAAKTNQDTLASSLLDILEHGGHGRLLMYDPATQQTTSLISGLNFANGVAVAHDQRSVLFNETGSYRVMRYWLKGDKKGKTEIVIDNLPGFPDNLARSRTGDYWLGLASPRSKALDDLSDSPFLRKMVQRLPESMRPKAQEYGHVIKLSENGQILQSLQDPSGSYPLTTGVLETSDFLYISSLTADKLARKALN